MSSYKASFKRYFEPFLGGSALFFQLKSRGIKFESYLSDLNYELINTNKIAASRIEELIEVLKIYEKEYDKILVSIINCETVQNFHRIMIMLKDPQNSSQ